MGNWYDDEDDDFEGDVQKDNSPKALREAQKAAARENAELKKQLANLQKQVAQRNLTDVLREKGLRPSLAKWIVKDEVDTSDPAAIETWLTENQEEFNYSLADGGSTDEQQAPDGLAAGYAAMQRAQENALPSGKFSEAQAAINNATSEQEINAALARAAG